MKKASARQLQLVPNEDVKEVLPEHEPHLALVEQVKLDLLSLVSHELRTPLHSILNALSLLRGENLEAEQKQSMLTMAHRNAQKLNDRLNQLLDLSKLVRGVLVCEFHEVPFYDVIRKEIVQFAASASADEKQLVFDQLPELPVILGDRTRLEQVLRALFDNAVRFSPKGSKIHLSVSKTENGIGLVIENSCSLAAAGHEEDFFKVFSQKEEVLNRVHEGIGGSLALSREVFRQHGGDLTIVCKQPRGVEQLAQFKVKVVLPVLESETALLKVLESRVYGLSRGLGAVSLMVLKTNNAHSCKPILEALQSSLFRASDSVYSLPDTCEVAVVMDDCKKQDAPKLVERLLSEAGIEFAKYLEPAVLGLSSCPEDTTDPEHLLDLARTTAAPIKR